MSRATEPRMRGVLLPALALLLGCLAGPAQPVWAADPVQLQLRVDNRERARIFSSGLQPVLGLADYFEFFGRDLLGRRQRMAEGPWNGTLRELRPGHYRLSGGDAPSGAEFNLTFLQLDPATVELTLRFTAPQRPAHLGFDIAKLAADLFLGAAVEAEPTLRGEVTQIPVAARPQQERMLLSGKNRLRLRGAFLDLDIVDLDGQRSIYLADGRNLPWDKRKSLIVGVTRDNLKPGEVVRYRYALRSLPASGGQGAGPRTVGAPVLPAQPWVYLDLPPKQQEQQPGMFRLDQRAAVFGRPQGMAERQLIAAVAERTGLALPVGGEGSSAAGALVFEPAATDDLPAEGFELAVSPDRVVIRWADERGRLYGAFALASRLRQTDQGWGWPCGRVRDWPDLAVRGLCMELLKPPVRDPALMKRYIEALAKARANTLILLHLPQHLRAWREGRDDGNWTAAHMAEFAAHARSLGMEVWGGMGSAFPPKDFPELMIRPGSNFYDPTSEASYATLFSLYEQILKSYRPSTLLISHDEVRGLNLYAAASGRKTAELFAAAVGRHHAWLKDRGLKTAIWGDMLLDHGVWERQVGSANSDHPGFNSGPTHEALPALPGDLRILDWHYRRESDYPSLLHFRSRGFEVIGAAWHDPTAARNFAAAAKRHGAGGIIATDWGIWPTLSPAATTLTAPLCGWSVNCPPVQDDVDVEALAALLRPPQTAWGAGRQLPVALGGVANARTAAGPSDPGLFGRGTALDLAALGVGDQVLGGVRFEPAGAAVVARAGDGAALRREVKLFSGRERARAIAFLHTAWLEAPQTLVRSLGRYRITYASGRTETIELRENWNLTDVRSTVGLRRNDWTFIRKPDALAGATTVWRGVSAAGVPLNLQLLVWDNPFPDETIHSIHLSAAGAPPELRLGVVGLTFLQD